MTTPPATFTPLADVQRYLGIPPAPDAPEQLRVLHALRTATAQIESFAGRWFSPRYAAIRHTPERPHRDEVILRGDLLTLTGAHDGDMPLTPQQVQLINGITLHRADGGAFYGAWVTVAGWWGWHNAPAQAWQDTGDAVSHLTLLPSAQVINVNNAGALQPDGISPRFAAGHLLRVGDELMQVLAVDVDDDTLTVARGVNGTSAQTHLIYSAIDRYHPPATVESLVVRWAAWRYRQADLPPTTGAPAELVAEALQLARPRVR